MDLFVKYIEVDGNRYKLQHPGNRAVLKLQSEAYNLKTGLTNMEAMLDYCFENVVIPEGHGFRPTIDNIKPKEFQTWTEILPGFLRGLDLGEYEISEDAATEG